MFMCGKGTYPETEKILHMSKIFNVTLDYLLNEEDIHANEVIEEREDICKPGNGGWLSFVPGNF